jgi:uncharacterized protein YndB with AHSA1/START domain
MAQEHDLSQSPLFHVSHETFVPREIIYDLWANTEHLQYWNPQLAEATLIIANPPQRLTYRIKASTVEATELDVVLTDVDGTTRIDVTQSSIENPDLPNSADAWDEVFRALENYLSAI